MILSNYYQANDAFVFRSGPRMGDQKPCAGATAIRMLATRAAGLTVIAYFFSLQQSHCFWYSGQFIYEIIPINHDLAKVFWSARYSSWSEDVKRSFLYHMLCATCDSSYKQPWGEIQAILYWGGGIFGWWSGACRSDGLGKHAQRRNKKSARFPE